MKSLFMSLMVMGTCLLLVVATSTPAEAKRLGGGSSFGSKFSHSDSVKRKSPEQSAQRQSSTPAAGSPAQQNSQLKQQMASKGGMMGILGGLAIGGLLGAMFFGGAFENINFMDILIFGLIAFLLFKIFAARSRQTNASATTASPNNQQFSTDTPYQSGGTETTSPPGNMTENNNSFGGITLDQLYSEISQDFDKEGFLEGAKSCYARLQQAWDDGDLADLRQFTTDHVFAELQEQLRNHQQSNDTKILSLRAELMSTRQLGESMEATVLFEARLNENGEEGTTSEVWHFIRPAGALTPTWYLDGIQQIEE